jgi:hypothetical protein
MSVEPEAIFSAVLIFMWVEFLWEALLSSRQRTIYKVGGPQISSANQSGIVVDLPQMWRLADLWIQSFFAICGPSFYALETFFRYLIFFLQNMDSKNAIIQIRAYSIKKVRSALGVNTTFFSDPHVGAARAGEHFGSRHLYQGQNLRT